MKKKYIITLLVLFAVVSIEGKKISKGRSSSSSRGSSRKTNSNPQPTSISHTQQASAPKPSLFGWQEKPAQRTQTQSKPSNSHSYPSSQTGMSGNSPPKQPSNQESIQRSNAPQNLAGQQTHTNNQPGHSYPSSHGLSGNSGSGAGYPQQGSGLSGSGSAHPQQGSGLSGSGAGYPQQGSGLSGSGAGYPQQGSGLSGSGAAAPPYSGGGNYHQPPPSYSNSNAYPKQQAPPPYNAGNYPANNYGNNYHHPQGAPPPYSNNYGGYGGHHGSYNNPSPQMPGYFGGYGNNGNRGFGGVGRSGSALTGVGIAGAGVGTLLTGLALWNLARSTGRNHHTVIYDNRGQPVAVAPDNNTEPVVDPILGDLVNCTLTISSDNATEVLAIPCSIATSFTPEADVKKADNGNNGSDNTKCTVTVVTKAGQEFMTTIPCSILLNSAAENNVTEPPLLNNTNDNVNGTTVTADGDKFNSNQPSSLSLPHAVNNTTLNCTLEPGDNRDPINPCFAVTQNLTVIPLEPNESSTSELLLITTPASA